MRIKNNIYYLYLNESGTNIMKKIIKEQELRNIVKKYISEALKYDKERRQYFPDYTGDPHSDAGKYVDNNRDDFNYSRNDYVWSDPEKQKRFQDLQWKNDLEIDPTDPNREAESEAEDYLWQREPYQLIDKAEEEFSGEFQTMIYDFLKKVSNKYPVLKEGYNMYDFVRRLRDVLDEMDF